MVSVVVSFLNSSYGLCRRTYKQAQLCSRIMPQGIQQAQLVKAIVSVLSWTLQLGCLVRSLSRVKPNQIANPFGTKGNSSMFPRHLLQKVIADSISRRRSAEIFRRTWEYNAWFYIPSKGDSSMIIRIKSFHYQARSVRMGRI